MVVAGPFYPIHDGVFAGSFQAGFRILVAQAQHCQGGIIALLFYADTPEDAADDFPGILSDGFRPAAYTGPAAPSARNFSPTQPEGSPTSRK